MKSKGKFKVGDTVVCNPNNPRVAKDRTNHKDGGWTPQYQDWLNGKHAAIVEISYSQIYAGMGLSYKLDVVGHDHSFYIQDADEMIPYVAPTLNVNREDFSEALRQEFLKQMEEDDKLAEEFNKGPIKSDGGSSDYYKIPLSENVIDKIVETGCIQVEDVIKYAFGNDFDFGNLFKAQVRLFGSLNGKGKAGNTPQYEYNKMEYTLTKKINNRLEESN